MSELAFLALKGDLAVSLLSAFARHQKRAVTPVTAVTSAVLPAAEGKFVTGPPVTEGMLSEFTANPSATKVDLVAGQNPSVPGEASKEQGYPQTDQNAAEATVADEVAAFEERAAIIEYDGDVPRAWAEALARTGLEPSTGRRSTEAVGSFLE